jgi:hypothetical protein
VKVQAVEKELAQGEDNNKTTTTLRYPPGHARDPCYERSDDR